MAEGTNRLEAFSDGVFAIAITLLVLDLRLPLDRAVGPGLAAAWPALLGFTLSFVTILIMWINHHGNLLLVERTDAAILFANGFLLLMVTFVPFPTHVLGEHLRGTDPKGAAAFYAASYILINVAWVAFWAVLVRRRAWAAPRLSDHEVRNVNVALAFGFCSYAVAAALAFVSAAASVGLCLLLAVFWSWQAVRRHRPAA